MTRLVPAVASIALTVLVLAAVVLVDRSGGDPAADARPTASPSPSPAPAETLAQQLERVQRIVADVRELEFTADPEVTVVTPRELAAQVEEQVAGYTPDEADLDRRILELLGAIPAGTDLRGLLVTALSEQVAGYYDPATGDLVVGAADPSVRVGRIEEITLAHELQHALADQRLGLPELDIEGDDDAVLARQALVEGDATVTMQAYVEAGFSPVDRLFIARESVELLEQLAGMTDLPAYLERSLVFPYEEGAAFVSALLDDGGWPAVDAAYADPPATTLEVLFPDRYLAGVTATVPEPGPDLPPPWRRARTTTLGAADLLFLFEAPGGDPARGLEDARGLAGRWEGGRLDLWVNGDRSAVSVAIATDGPALCDAVTTWLDRADPSARTAPGPGDTAVVRGTDRQAVVACEDGEVRLGLGDDEAVARRLSTRP